MDSLLTIDETARRLGRTTDGLLAEVANYNLRCGVLGRGWHALALPREPDPAPNEDGICWKGWVVSHGQTPRETRYRYRSDQGHDLEIFGFDVGGFWFIDPVDAYEIAVKGSHPITWLLPDDGAEMHTTDPSRFPAPDFMAVLLDDSPASRVVTSAQLMFAATDIAQFKSVGTGSPGRPPILGNEQSAAILKALQSIGQTPLAYRNSGSGRAGARHAVWREIERTAGKSLFRSKKAFENKWARMIGEGEIAEEK